MHFYEEAHELNKVPVDDSVRRVYMARHIIDKYIVAGKYYFITQVSFED